MNRLTILMFGASLLTLASANLSMFGNAFFCHGKEGGDYPAFANCNGFLTCLNGVTYHKSCPAGLVWNDLKKLCDWKSKVALPCGNLLPGHMHPTGCHMGQKVKDKCDQVCTCTSLGTLADCTRIRYEFTAMTTEERKRYVRTVKTASTDKKFRDEYNTLIILHNKLFIHSGIHDKENFLPWHRWYVLQYENLLRKVDCKVTVPYWDWSSVSKTPWEATSDDIWYKGDSGFGGTGTAPTYCVKDGPFMEGKWTMPSLSQDGVVSFVCLTRNFSGNPPNKVDLASLLTTPPSEFEQFELTLRTTFHDNIHCLIGENMCSLDSGAAPEFFLHHAMVDKIWTDWQKKSIVNKNVFFRGLNAKLPSTSGLLSYQLIDNQALPGRVRVLYAETNNPLLEEIDAQLQGASAKMLREIPRAGFSGIRLSAIKLFDITAKEVREGKELAKVFKVPEVKVKNEPFEEFKLGFDFTILDKKGSFCVGKHDGNYRNPKDSNGFIACSKHNTYHVPCPSKMEWNDAEKKCTLPKVSAHYKKK